MNKQNQKAERLPEIHYFSGNHCLTVSCYFRLSMRSRVNRLFSTCYCVSHPSLLSLVLTGLNTKHANPGASQCRQCFAQPCRILNALKGSIDSQSTLQSEARLSCTEELVS